MKKKIIMCVLGTRPEAIKMAPVIIALRESCFVDSVIVSTGQHKEILYQTLNDFNINVDFDLNIMQKNQTLGNLTAKLFEKLEAIIINQKPNLVLAQGDTTSVLVAALVSFYNGIPFGHIEAGLRSHNLQHPFPEELNRVVVSKATSLHFAPTRTAAENLKAEGVAQASIKITGNTVIDSLYWMSKQTSSVCKNKKSRNLLVTIHRRENFGEPLERICNAILEIQKTFDDLEVFYPVHPNPNIRDVVFKMLNNVPRIHLLEPQTYKNMVRLMKNAKIILTDSGGIQEEAPALGIPVVVARDTTERPEAVQSGSVKLVGSESFAIYHAISRLLSDQEYYNLTSRKISPYGDGFASERIVKACMLYLNGLNLCDFASGPEWDGRS